MVFTPKVLFAMSLLLQRLPGNEQRVPNNQVPIPVFPSIEILCVQVEIWAEKHLRKLKKQSRTVSLFKFWGRQLFIGTFSPVLTLCIHVVKGGEKQWFLHIFTSHIGEILCIAYIWSI